MERWLVLVHNGVDIEQTQTKDIVIKNIEEEDHLWAAKDRRREKRRLKKEHDAAAGAMEEANKQDSTNDDSIDSKTAFTQTKKPPAFY